MIFKLEGVRNLLALTPVLHEWKQRGFGEVLVETSIENVLEGNPDVDEVSLFFSRDDQEVLDMDQVMWSATETHVTESYCIAVFGDVSLESWRIVMEHTPEDEKVARSMLPEGKVALLGPGFIENRNDIADELKRMGYSVMTASGDVGWGIFRAMAGACDLYVGEQGDESVVALTTNVPGVVLYRWESPVYFAPFRKFPTFEAIVPPPEVCDMSGPCLAANGVCEFGRVFGVRCPKSPRYACVEKWDNTEAVINGVEKATMNVNGGCDA
jgi:hypothetical protein